MIFAIFILNEAAKYILNCNFFDLPDCGKFATYIETMELSDG